MGSGAGTVGRPEIKIVFLGVFGFFWTFSIIWKFFAILFLYFIGGRFDFV